MCYRSGAISGPQQPGYRFPAYNDSVNLDGAFGNATGLPFKAILLLPSSEARAMPDLPRPPLRRLVATHSNAGVFLEGRLRWVLPELVVNSLLYDEVIIRAEDLITNPTLTRYLGKPERLAMFESLLASPMRSPEYRSVRTNARPRAGLSWPNELRSGYLSHASSGHCCERASSAPNHGAPMLEGVGAPRSARGLERPLRHRHRPCGACEGHCLVPTVWGRAGLRTGVPLTPTGR